MMPQPFLLAVPQGWSTPGEIGLVERPSAVRADCPRLWMEKGTRSISLGEHGLIVGRIFRRGSTSPMLDFIDGLPIGEAPARLAARLARDYWGAYFAILADPGDGELFVFPDPSGLLPVYRYDAGSHVLLTSDPRLLAAAGAGAPSVSWAGLYSHLVRPELRGRATCLANVRELSPGLLVRASGDPVDGVPIWRPDDFMPCGKTPGFDEAAEALRSCVLGTVDAWARLAGPVTVAASGGVDSSLICAALAQAGNRFDCITLATSDPSGDESAFVRALADHLGVKVAAATYDPDRVDLLRPASNGLPRPARKTFMQALDAALDDGRRELGAATVFDGNGGDNLFCFLHSAAPVLDCLAVEGGRPAVQAFLDMCGVTGCDVFAMAGAVLRRAVRGGIRCDWSPDQRLLADGWAAAVAFDPLTPWLDVTVGPHRGKRDHLDLIMRAQNHIHGLGGIPWPRFSPLMSQPLIELCLSLPTWLWCGGGINRALARSAFADVLPPAIRRRTSKAGPDSFIRKLFTAKRGQIADLLLGGLLAREGLIDLRATTLAIETDVLSTDAIAYRLLDLVEAEAWARSWSR